LPTQLVSSAAGLAFLLSLSSQSHPVESVENNKSAIKPTIERPRQLVPHHTPKNVHGSSIDSGKRCPSTHLRSTKAQQSSLQCATSLPSFAVLLLQTAQIRKSQFKSHLTQIRSDSFILILFGPCSTVNVHLESGASSSLFCRYKLLSVHFRRVTSPSLVDRSLRRFDIGSP
jgi:hypothetical protein